MYLEKAKNEFYELLNLVRRPLYYESCSLEDVQEVREILKLPIPEVYEEFLLWIGNGSDFSDPFSIGHCSKRNTNLQKVALEIMNDNGTSEILPEDAIVFVIPEENCSFAFIRASEGSNPPIHFFPGFMKGEDGKYRTVHHFIWNWFPNLEELCIAWIEDYMALALGFIER